MSVPELAPRRAIGGIVGVWIFAAVVSLVIGIVAPPEWRAAWMAVGLGTCLFASYAVQLAYGRVEGFIERVAASILGALLVMGFIGVGFGLSTLFAV